MESREDLTVTRPDSSLGDPAATERAGMVPLTSGDTDGNIGSDEVRSSVPSECIQKLIALFESRAEELDLALMQVIATGGSPAEWLSGMLRQTLPPADERPRFLGE